MVLDNIYHINITIFQNYAINDNSLNNYDLEFILNNTSNEHDLQSVYNGNGFLGIITDLSHISLAIYDTGMSSHTYTGSENTGITYTQISLKFPIQMNDETVLNPRLNEYVELHAGTSGFSLLQHIVDGSQPMASFNSLDKPVTLFRDLDIPNCYNKHEADAIDDELPSLILNTYTKTKVNKFITNIDLSGSGNINITSNEI